MPTNPSNQSGHDGALVVVVVAPERLDEDDEADDEPDDEAREDELT